MTIRAVRTRRRILPLAAGGVLVLAGAVVASPAVGRGLPILGDQSQEKTGTGWVANPDFVHDAAARAAIAEILGVDLPEWPGVSDQAFAKNDKSIDPSALQWYQENLPTLLLYRIPSQGGASGTPGTTQGASTERGAVRDAATPSGDQQGQEWLQNVVWNGDGKHGGFRNLAVLSSLLVGAEENNAWTFNWLASNPNSLLPEVGPGGIITKPKDLLLAGVTENVYGSRALLDAIAQRPPASEAQRHDKRSLARALDEPAADDKAKASCAGGVCDSKGNVYAAQTLYGQCAGGSCSSFGGLLGNGPFTNAFSGLFGNLTAQLQQIFSRFGNLDLQNLLGRFSLQTLTGLTSRFGPTQLNSLLGSQGFLGGGGGGGGDRLSRPPEFTVLASSPECSAPILSPNEVADIADVLGMPRSAQPWPIQFQTLASFGTVTGTDPNTGQVVTIGPASFPDETCAWVVRAGTDVTVASDRLEGGQIRLTP